VSRVLAICGPKKRHVLASDGGEAEGLRMVNLALRSMSMIKRAERAYPAGLMIGVAVDHLDLDDESVLRCRRCNANRTIAHRALLEVLNDPTARRLDLDLNLSQ
jgi:hypothetical protein